MLVGTLGLVLLLLASPAITVQAVADSPEDPRLGQFKAPVVCGHDEVAVPISELPVVEVDYGTPTVMQPSKGPVARAAQNVMTVSSTMKNMRFLVVYFLNETCTKVGDSAPTYVSGGTRVCEADDVLTPNKKANIEAIFSSAVDYLRSTLKVQPVASIKASPTMCSLTGDQFIARDVDFIVFVTAAPSPASSAVVARGGACARDSKGRPIVGHVTFRTRAVSGSRLPPGSVFNLNARIGIHEIMHALGFTSLAASLDRYMDLNGVYQYGGTVALQREGLRKSVTLVRTPRVLQKAREYFGCDTLDGIEIEDGGGDGTAGSHWEKRILSQDVMVGMVTTAALFVSPITLAAFEDMGFYEADYAFADTEMNWGRRKGCGFLYNRCNEQQPNVTEFCFEMSSGLQPKTVCTNDRLGIGTCQVATYTTDLSEQYRYFSDPRLGGLEVADFCPIVIGFNNLECTNAENFDAENVRGSEFHQYSRCFTSNIYAGIIPTGSLSARCFPFACTASGTLLVRVQGQTIRCPEGGSAGEADARRLFGIHGRLICPEAHELCDVPVVPPRQAIPLPPPDEGGASPGQPALPVAVSHAPLDNWTTPVSPDCQVRAASAAGLEELLPSCRLMARKLRQRFGNDCNVELNIWLLERGFGKRCRLDDEFSKECQEGAKGVLDVCTMLSGAAGTLAAFSLATVVAVLAPFLYLA